MADINKTVNFKVNGIEKVAQDVDNLNTELNQTAKTLENIGDVELEKTADKFLKLGESAVAGFSLIKIAQGGTEEDLQKLQAEYTKLILTLQSIKSLGEGFEILISVTKGLSQATSVLALIEKSSLATKILNNAQIAIENGLQSSNIIIKKAAAAAQWLLNAALNASPLAILTGLIVAATAAWAAYKLIVDDNTESVEELNSKTLEYFDTLNKQISNQEKLIRLGSFDKATNQEKIRQLKELREEYRKQNDLLVRNALIQSVQAKDEATRLKAREQLIEAQIKRLEDEKRLTDEINKLQEEINKNRDTRTKEDIKRIEARGLVVVENAEKEKKALKEVADTRDSLSEAVDREYQKIVDREARIQEAVAQIFNLTSVGLNAISDLLAASNEKQIAQLEEQKTLIDEQLTFVDDRLQQSADKQKAIEEDLANSRGRRRARLLDDLAREKKAQEQAEKDRQALEDKKLKKDEEIAKKRQEAEITAQKIAIAQTAIQIATQSGLAIAALAAQSAKQDPTFGIATIGGIAALGIALGVQIKKMKDLQSEFKFEKGGIIKGNSHANGGVPIMGGTAEVEGGELIVNKNIWSRPSFVKAISEMNYATGGKRFYANGGVLPTNFDAINSGVVADPNIDLFNRIADLADRPIYTSVVDINTAQTRVTKIVDSVTIS